MRNVFRIICALCLVLAAAGCNRDGFNKSDLEITDVCLRVKGEEVFAYIPYATQMSLNRGRKEFRAGTDTMSDYFLLKMSELPREHGQVFTGEVAQGLVNHDFAARKCVKLCILCCRLPFLCCQSSAKDC